jgi:hypothetical protein
MCVDCDVKDIQGKQSLYGDPASKYFSKTKISREGTT